MATTMHRFRVAAKNPPSRIIAQIRTTRTFERRRCFNIYSPLRESKADKESNADTLLSSRPSAELAADPGQNISASIPPAIDENLGREFEEILRKHGRIHQNMPEELKKAPPFREVRKKPKPGALNMGVPLAEDPIDDPEFEEDDITSIAHGQLEQHREFRHYARLAAWEMPLLTKMAKPFVPPTQKEVLRFRYTTYMGEYHPAEKKVVVEFCPDDMLDLTDIQRDKLRKLVGSRWNPETDIIKMSCEMFETQAQNKRYLGDLVEKLLHEAKDSTDTFEDIPLDTRHHHIKTKPRFPTAWRMTDQRRTELEESRRQAERLDQERASQGSIVDGVQQIQAALAKPARLAAGAGDAVEPQLVTAGKKAAKSKKLRLR